MYQSHPSTLFIGKNITYIDSCQSTNDEAVTRYNNGDLAEGEIIITDKQIAGKGQRGNLWESQPRANLTFSILLKPTFLGVSKQFDLNVVVALALLDVLKSFDSGFQVKWPNDIYYYNKKVCGMLIQNSLKKHSIETSVVGIGLNINQREFVINSATSLSLITSREHSLPQVLEQLISCIEVRYLELRAGNNAALRATYLENMYWYGEDHIFRNGEAFTGRIVGISPEGKLEIETKNGIRSFGMKEVEFVN